MANLKKYNLQGTAVGEVEVSDDYLTTEANPQMIKDYIVALRANVRQWSASTLGRSEVSHSTKKPHRQKGTGGARQGSLAAPQYKGGGVVFGPKPKFDQHVRINQKERRLAIRSLLADKIKTGRVLVVEDKVFNEEFSTPKTKNVHQFLKAHELAGKRVLFVSESFDSDAKKEQSLAFKRSTRNLPKCGYVLAPNINGYDVLVAQGIVVTESALKELVKA